MEAIVEFGLSTHWKKMIDDFQEGLANNDCALIRQEDGIRHIRISDQKQGAIISAPISASVARVPLPHEYCKRENEGSRDLGFESGEGGTK